MDNRKENSRKNKKNLSDYGRIYPKTEITSAINV